MSVKVLVVATQKTALASRMAIVLANVGFRVGTLTPHGNPVRKLRSVQDHFTTRTRSPLKSATQAIYRWSPDLIVCTDDFAVTSLQTLYQRTMSSRNKAARYISELIDLSLGPATSFPAIRDKSTFLVRAQTEGLRCPSTIIIPAARALKHIPPDLSYPICVKADQSYGGICVRAVNREADVRATVWELQSPRSWHSMLRRLFGAICGSTTLAGMLPLRRAISLQEYIQGRPANRAVVCWKGKVLAGISVEALEVGHPHGPASVVRVIDHPEMARVADHMVEQLYLSGFVGFDFVLDSRDQAWLIEMNPRVTQISHFSLDDGTNLAASLYRQLARTEPRPECAAINRGTIALFPNEIVRSACSKYLRSNQHDVPWSEPEFVSDVVGRALQTTILGRVHAFLERYPKVIDALVKFGIVVRGPKTEAM
jgi:glutathione synthase/RimK-type ligase-like ATP-grasp enzyme